MAVSLHISWRRYRRRYSRFYSPQAARADLLALAPVEPCAVATGLAGLEVEVELGGHLLAPQLVDIAPQLASCPVGGQEVVGPVEKDHQRAVGRSGQVIILRQRGGALLFAGSH